MWHHLTAPWRTDLLIKHKSNLKYLLKRYGHQELAEAMVELAKEQEAVNHANNHFRHAAMQRTQIWQQASEALIAVSQHLATAKQLDFHRPA